MSLRDESAGFGGWSRSFQESLRSSGSSSSGASAEAFAHRVVKEGDWRYRLESDGDEAYGVLCGYSGSESRVVIPEALGGAPVRKIAARALSVSCIDCIEIPAALQEVEPNSIAAPNLEEVVVSADNASLKTDGIAIYSADGSRLLACPVRVCSYSTLPECRTIGDAAFKGMTALTELSLNEGLESIGAFAFFRTSIEKLDCPASLLKIGEKAFASSKVASVKLNEGLEDIASQSFASTEVSSVHLPASLKHLGDKAFWRSKVDFNDVDAFAVDEANRALLFDRGLLYSKDAEGLHLIEAIAPSCCCTIADGTVQICSHAFENDSEIEEIIFPAGLVLIGERAFASCKNLKKADLPDSLRLVGAEAFYGTKLRSVSIGERLTDIGPCAFEVAGEGRLPDKPQLDHIDVDANNPRYRLVEGMLIEKRDAGERVLLYAGDGSRVSIPEGVVEVAEMAFYNARFDELFIPSTLKKVSQRGFLGAWGFAEVHIEYPIEYQGYSSITVPFPREPRDRWDYSRALAINPNGMFLDFEIFDAYAVHELDTARVVEIALARLLNPIDLSFASKANYESAVLRYLPHALETFEQDENAKAVDDLKKYWASNAQAKDAACELIATRDDKKLQELFVKITKE